MQTKKRPTASDKYLAHVTKQIHDRLAADKPVREIARELDLNINFVGRIHVEWVEQRRQLRA